MDAGRAASRRRAPCVAPSSTPDLPTASAPATVRLMAKKAHFDVDVVVVGGGLSGLRAADRLVKKGRSVKLLEARDRVGGRTWTKTIGKGTFDVGGQWIGPGQHRLASLAKELGVETFPTFDDGTKILEVRGKRTTYKSQIPSVNPLALVQMQAALSLLDFMRKRVPAGAPLTAANADVLDAMTLESWRERYVKSRTVKGLMDVAVRIIFGAEASELSVLYFLEYLNQGGGLLRLAEIRDGAQQDRFKTGAQSISVRLAERLGDIVQLDAPVESVDTSGEGALVRYAGGELRARRVILAVPPTLLGQVRFTPRLPSNREQLLARYPMGATIKFLVTYDKAFWREAGFSGEVVCTEGPISAVFDNTSHDGAQPCLVGFIVAKHARQLSTISEAERRATVVSELTRFFGQEAAEPTEYVDQDWAAEPWSRGCPVSLVGPGALSTTRESLREAVGRVHFASTETAREWMGYLEGALEAGDRAAAEVEHAFTAN